LHAPLVSAAGWDAAALEQQLSRLTAFGFNQKQTAALQQFYAARNFQPVWISPDKDTDTQSPLLTEAITFITSADAEGLDSRDYQLPQLRLLQQQADPSADAAIELEIRTTLAVVELSHDLARGRLVAAQADPSWHIAQPEFDAVSFLLTAINRGDLRQSFANLAPRKPGYQSLRQTLNRYQKLLENHDGWLHIPASKAIQPGTTNTVIPLIRKRIAQAYQADGVTEYHVGTSDSTYYDDELVTAIQAFQAQHGLNTDGVIGRNTIQALNTSLSWKIRQLRINMERLRWLPRDLGERYLLVNTAGFRLTAAEQGRHVLSMRIIVGREYRSTPSFDGALSHMVLNPYWNVPVSIARKDLLPKQQNDPDYFTSQHIRVYPGYNRNAEAIDPDTVDWQAIQHGFPYVLRQDPGQHNALGQIKFMFANPFNIYLHDTPSKSLFQKDIRTFSSGCIRLEKPLELAAFALNTPELPDDFRKKIESGETRSVHLTKQLPVYLVYITAWVDEQEKVHFSPDIYDRDLHALRYAGW